MFISKLLPLGRLALRAGPGQRHFISTSSKRMSDAPWTYREFTLADKKYEIWAEAVGAMMWWWVFWHLFSDYEHLIGEKKFIYAETWTDEELGIPPDDADDPE
ncbi:NADH dehydrogenase [ubiquinone] 1 beta subcomplex subunit 2, mitochondrial [Folsomia candida]|uniref:NADH dehydrogenase [ubiquinone] 1 beta subcomplex subunit 2, mitochondrial n=1 Tax=Folsomia candida TaxID=158441 RepID=UPI000B8F496A|nr:NADH dehydrogenase [ubiquinone] 1 beta subcomplex subunit 2, mitochondrial [Folsomia candida]